MKETGRILAVDPGEKNIGIAISDSTATIATPYLVITHISRQIDAAQIAQIAQENQVVKIIVGMPTGGEGEIIPQSRHSQRFADSIRGQSDLQVILWDESNSSQSAKMALIELKVPKSKRRGHQDDFAAAVILQSYLDAQNKGESIDE
ncbi:MAG: Holliday junction resolvase RuvX [Anaerolineaceae bacterium]